MADKQKIVTLKIFSPNLLPRLWKENLCLDSVKSSIFRILFLGLFLLIVLWLMGGFLLFGMKNEKAQLDQSLSTEKYGEKLTELDKSNGYSRESRVFANKIEKSIEKQYSFSNLLEELMKTAPRGLTINSLDTPLDQPGTVKIMGVAKERDGFLKFKENLEKSEFCEKVESPLSNYIEPENLNFELTLKLKNWKPIWGESLEKTASPVKNEAEEEN